MSRDALAETPPGTWHKADGREFLPPVAYLPKGSRGYQSYSALMWPQDETSTAVLPMNQS